MSTKPPTHSYLEVIDEASGWLVGGGIVSVALFPLALPALALIAIAALPLLLLPLVGAVVVGLIVLPLRLALRALRALRRRRDRPATNRSGSSPGPRSREEAAKCSHPAMPPRRRRWCPSATSNSRSRVVE
jgi:hypothetical protein